MIHFENLNDLRAFLYSDRDEVSLCPLRFINVDSMEMWVNVKKMLLSMSTKHVCLSSFCAQEDTTPNMRRFSANIRNVEENICVSPLSEFLRVNPDIAKSSIEELLSREYPGNIQGKLRIYIPMYRMKSVLEGIGDADPRKKNAVLIMTSGEDSDYSLTVIQKNLQVDISGNEIYGFRQYLQYWEQNPDKPLILHTKNAIHFSRRTFFDDVRVIVTSYDLLKMYYQLPAEFDEECGKEEYWDRLAISTAAEHSFEAACCHELLINKYTSKLFDRWQEFDDFQKWLLWLWTRIKQPKGYLGQCIEQSGNLEEFKQLVFDNITGLLGNAHFDEYYAERRALLQKMDMPVPTNFWTSVEQLSALDQLRVLTDLTEKERKAIFNALQNIAENERMTAIEILNLTYPALSKYLYDDPGCILEDMTEDLSEYFREYRWCKAVNILPDAFMKRVNRYATMHGEPVYALNARNSIVAEEYDENTAILFADGMGVEYVNYLYFVLNQLKSEGYTIRARVGYCNLPTITEVNKDFLRGRRVVEELSEPDEMKHSKEHYPKTIENELTFLNSLKGKVRNSFSNGISRVILTTDHGTSRMAVLVRTTEFDHKLPSKGHTIYKYGRYCEGTDMAPEIPTAIEYDDKLIFADYQRFDQKGSPIDETHGGASLEEWLVPIFIIENTSTRNVKIKIIPPEEQLKPDSFTKMVTVRFSLEKYGGDDVSVRVHGRKILCKKAESQFEFKYSPKKNETSVEVKVYKDYEYIGDFKFSVKQGIIANKKFDL